MGGRAGAWMVGWLAGWMDGWMDGWMHGGVCVCVYTLILS